MDILRKIANQLERIADHLTGEHIEEKTLTELCETCASEECHGCMLRSIL